MNYEVLTGISRAKVNLHLNVLNRRPDGYHNIFSLMAELELHDILKLREYRFTDTGEVSVFIENAGGRYASVLDSINPQENLIAAGARNYLARLGKGGSFTFTIEKNIPSGAGLGGGSSNGACAIDLVRRALGRMKDEICFAGAADTGSDVAFFLYGGFAFARGRGEILEPAGLRNSSAILLINNGIHVNTGEAYKDLNRPVLAGRPEKIRDQKKISKLFNDTGSWKKVMINDFERVIFRKHPDICRLKDELYDLGADFAAMTGSGSTVFGVFSNHETAARAELILKKENNVILTAFSHS